MHKNRFSPSIEKKLKIIFVVITVDNMQEEHLKQDIRSHQTLNMLSPALCGGRATFTIQDPVSPLPVQELQAEASGFTLTLCVVCVFSYIVLFSRLHPLNAVRSVLHFGTTGGYSSACFTSLCFPFYACVSERGASVSAECDEH